MRNAITSFAVIIALAACGDGGTGPNPADDKLAIRGSAMGRLYQSIYVHRGEDPSDATVIVNGFTIPPDDEPGKFYGILPNEVPVGEQITIRVTDGDLEAIGTALGPSRPEITNLTGTRASGNIAVEWISATSPDSFLVSVGYVIDGRGRSLRTTATGSSRQASMSLADLPVGATSVAVTVWALNGGSFIGDATSTSKMNVREVSFGVPVQ